MSYTDNQGYLQINPLAGPQLRTRRVTRWRLVMCSSTLTHFNDINTCIHTHMPLQRWNTHPQFWPHAIHKTFILDNSTLTIFLKYAYISPLALLLDLTPMAAEPAAYISRYYPLSTGLAPLFSQLLYSLATILTRRFRALLFPIHWPCYYPQSQTLLHNFIRLAQSTIRTDNVQSPKT